MNRRQTCPGAARRAFTLIELLTVIAIIAVLAAILFPIFGTVREQARQSSTMSNLQSIYVATKLFYEDEQRYPQALFGYAIRNSDSMPALPTDTPDTIVPMADTKQQFGLASGGLNKGYLYGEQVKSINTFFSPGNLITDQKLVTHVYYPKQVSDLLGLTYPAIVTWQQSYKDGNGCDRTGDTDLPGAAWINQPKLFYVMDSVDIGPALDNEGKWLKDSSGNSMYELHYSPDWSRLAGIVNGDVTNACSDGWNFGGGKVPVLNQMKWKNPPTDRTVVTYVTHHAANSGSPNVIILLLSGTARKIGLNQADQQLPLNYAR